MKTIREYKNEGLAALKGNWPRSVVASFVVLVLSGLANLMVWGFDCLDISEIAAKGAWVMPVLAGSMILVLFFFMFFLVMPVVVGMINAFARMYSHSDGMVLENMKKMAFSDSTRSALGMLAMNIVVSLYSILLFVPGVIASLALFLTPYILKDNPELSIMETLRLSRRMMDGHKMQLFKLQLSFIGWILLNILTLGIASLWLIPYIMTTFAAFYQDVRTEYEIGQHSAA